ncbi:MAG: hypothetical protein DQL93_07905 [Lactobacillus delbrueckii subsp. lactis]|uniref:Uncharacterized protein n=1 Tax=Lactobacillus delbrueckii subsp. lactis TaxID=29397 RepID=A0A3G6JGI7_LACDL|nr:MAG: hypothetical protein DQL93_07905 [Lactobacillus delbrueckii subsp. lactis]AZA17260.1 MAG: hypothetical protein DQL93_0405 [Lactobacillus phage ViSo-2018b]
MTKTKKAVASLLTSPLHAIVGLDLLVTGLILLIHRHYFFWPPWPSWVMEAENDIAVGLIGVVAGLGMFYWAISTDKSIRLNRILIPTASAYFTFLAVIEFLHGVFSQLGTPHMYTSGLSELIMTLITLHMARNTPTE